MRMAQWKGFAFLFWLMFLLFNKFMCTLFTALVLIAFYFYIEKKTSCIFKYFANIIYIKKLINIANTFFNKKWKWMINQLDKFKSIQINSIMSRRLEISFIKWFHNVLSYIQVEYCLYNKQKFIELQKYDYGITLIKFDILQQK